MTVIGCGAIALKNARGTATDRVIRYAIEHSHIDFYDPSSKQAAQDLSAFLANLLGEDIADQGHLNLFSLPASPQAAFGNVKLTATADSLILRVQHSEKFAQLGKTYFENLDLSFITPKLGTGLTVEGTVTLRLFGRSDLAVVLNVNSSSEGLSFSPSQSSIPIPGVGSLNINEVRLGNSREFWSGLQVLYTFNGGTEYEFWNGAKNLQQPAKLTFSGDKNSLKYVPGGIMFLNSGPEPSRAVRLESIQSGRALSEKCKVSQAITISAWIKPAEELTSSINVPKRIVSLSTDTGKRNFTLGQDLDRRKNSDGKQYNRYIVRLRRENGSPNGMPPLVSKPQAFKVGELAHVVITRGDSSSPLAPGKIFINGKDQTALDPSDLALGDDAGGYTNNLSGSFESWDVNYPLLLGDEKVGTRAWSGEIHQIAIYNRALSELEIFHSYVPDLSIKAKLVFDGVPAPFNQALPVTVNVDTSEFIVDVPEAVLQVAPFFTLDQLKFKWQQQDSGLELLSGEVKATLWDYPVDFALTLNENSFALARSTSAATTLTLHDVAPLSPLGILKLTTLTLQSNRTGDGNWKLETDAQVTFETLPPPLKGPFPVELFLEPLPPETRKLWFSISPLIQPGRPLPLVESWGFTKADLQFTRDDSGWQVQPDLRGGSGGISLSLLGENCPLMASLEANNTIKVLKLKWEATDGDKPLGQQDLGLLNLSHFKLESLTPGSNEFWQVSLAGKIPLDLSSGEEPAAPENFTVLDFSTVNGKLLGNPANLKQPLQLRGQSRLQSQVSINFENGDLQLQEDRLLLQGLLTLFPAWSTVQLSTSQQVVIAADRQVLFERNTAGSNTVGSNTVQVTLPESVLVNPKLTLANGRLELKGFWLGHPEAQVFRVRERAGELFLNSYTECSLPFSLSLPALIDDKTGAQLTQAIEVTDREMAIQLDTKFQASGFLGVVKASFAYEDSAEVLQTFTLPERRLYSPPASLSALLGEILGEVKATADELFKGQGRHPKEYYVTLGANQPRIALRGPDDSKTEITSVMPVLFKEEIETLPKNSIFALKQDSKSCTLTLKLTESDPGTVKASYKNFLVEVEKKSLINAGAMTLLKRRIAECLPLDYDDLLFYYYGWDVAQGYIDLQAGMRLRVDLQNYQFVQSSDPAAKSGFVGSGSFYIPVNSYNFPQSQGSPLQLLGFGPFLSRLQVNGSLDITNQGAGNVLDLLREGYRKPYYRLFFPRNPSRGSSSERSVTLVGTDTLKDMPESTDAVVSNAGSSLKTGISFFFRGRAVILPEIQVYVGHKPTYVSVGTTLRQLKEMYDDIPAAGLPGQNLQSFLGSDRTLRLVHEGVNSTPSYRFINFKGSGSVGNMDVLDLPLVKGDRICP